MIRPTGGGGGGGRPYWNNSSHKKLGPPSGNWSRLPRPYHLNGSLSWMYSNILKFYFCSQFGRCQPYCIHVDLMVNWWSMPTNDVKSFHRNEQRQAVLPTLGACKFACKWNPLRNRSIDFWITACFTNLKICICEQTWTINIHRLTYKLVFLA